MSNYGYWLIAGAVVVHIGMLATIGDQLKRIVQLLEVRNRIEQDKAPSSGRMSSTIGTWEDD